MQVVGFTDKDSHNDVLKKGANGLGLKCNLDLLQLLCSGGIVLNSPIGDNLWTLGEYIKQHGGNQNRSKKVWGINVPIDYEDVHVAAESSDTVSAYIVHVIIIQFDI